MMSGGRDAGNGEGGGRREGGRGEGGQGPEDLTEKGTFEQWRNGFPEERVHWYDSFSLQLARRPVTRPGPRYLSLPSLPTLALSCFPGWQLRGIE